MVYIYKKIINGNPYYYLRASKKFKGKTVVRDIAYLGKNLSEVKTKLENLKQYKKAVRKAYKNIKRYMEAEYYINKITQRKLKRDKYLDKELLEKVESAREHYIKKFLKSDKETINETYKNFLIDFAYNTTSIEGNTITLSEAHKLLEENFTPKNKTLREIYDLQNTQKVFFEVINIKREMNNDFIVHIHTKLMENIDERRDYRTYDIRVFRARFKASPAEYVKADMQILIDWFKEYENKLHPFVLASIFHQKFEKIHPFADGNGRVGRMLLCFILMNKGYPPVIIRKLRRPEYLNALALADKADLKSIEPKPYKPLTKYLAEEFINSYWNNFLV